MPTRPRLLVAIAAVAVACGGRGEKPRPAPAGGGTERRLTDDPGEDGLAALTRGGCEPHFSRDGSKVVYVSRRHLKETSELVEHDLATGAERALVSWPALNYDPVYSPDGSELAFASNITDEYAVYRQRLSDRQAWRVTFGPGAARCPDYRPVSP